MKNSSQTQRCRSKIRGKNSRKQKKLEHYMNAFPASTVHPVSTIHASSVLLHFTHCCFFYNFWFLPILTLVIAFVLVFFFVISYTLSTYISLSLYKLKSTDFTSVIESGSFPVAFSFLHFPSFSLPFSATKHSFEDDNSKDGWLDLFLLEEEGCWLGFEVN